MALLLLILIGVSAGWLASIIARTEEAGEVVRQIGVGVIASLVVGILSNGNSILGGLTPIALLLSITACAASLLTYHLVIRDRLRT